MPTCSTCVYGYSCSVDEEGERTRPRDDCLKGDHTHWEHGDPILRRRELEFSGKINIVLDGETEVNRLWDMAKTRKHLNYVCNEVGGLSYSGPEPHSLRVETSYGPAFDIFFEEKEKTMTHILIKRSAKQDITNWIDFRDPVTDWR